MEAQDPYQTLGLSKNATQGEIKNAYRNLAKKHHPDLNPGSKDAEKNFKKINHAYELLGSTEQRAKFDRGELDHEQTASQRQKHRPSYYETQNEAGNRYTYSFGEGIDESIFESIFGNSRQRTKSQAAGSGQEQNTQSQGEDLLFKLEISLKDAVLGSEKELTLPQGKRLKVKIPNGITSGTKLRFTGQGSAGSNGGASGDAYIEVEVQPSDQFKLVGNDLYTEVPVSIAAAALGGEIKVPTIDGTILMKIPPRVNTDTKLRIAGKGFFDRKAQKRGDQIISLKVFLPDPIDSELLQAIQNWKDRHPENQQEKTAA